MFMRQNWKHADCGVEQEGVRPMSKPDGTFAIPAMASSDPRALLMDRYGFSVAPEGTGLKPVHRSVGYNGSVREVDVGDIYVENEEEQEGNSSETETIFSTKP